MKGTLTEIVALLDHSRAFTEAVVQTTDNPTQRPLLLARAMHRLWPSPLALCVLRSPDGFAVCALDEAGDRRPEWEPLLTGDVVPWVKESQPAEITRDELPEGLGLPGHGLAGARITSRGHRYGVLALALPSRQRAKVNALARALLTREANHLGLLLHLEELERQPPAPAERPAPAGMSYFPEIAHAVAHEFNNVLNNILLQVAILEQTGKAREALPALAFIRQVGNNAAAMIRQLQQLSQQSQAALLPVDLNRHVREEVERYRARQGMDPASVRVELAPDLPPVSGTADGVADLVGALLRNAAVADGQGAVTVRTQRADGRIVLRVEDPGAGLTEEQLHRAFEPFAVARPGGETWDLTVCKALTRRLRGTIHAENRPEGGMAFIVELRPA